MCPPRPRPAAAGCPRPYRGAQRRAAHAAHRGEPEDQIVGAGHAVQEGGDGGDQQIGPRDPHPLGGLVQGARLGGGEDRGTAQERSPGRRGAVGEPHRLGQPRQPLRPVRAVASMAVGAEVGGLLGGEPVRGLEAGGRRFLPGGQRRVGVGQTTCHQLVAVAVQQDVVGAQEPDEPVGGERQQGVREERPRRHVHRRRQVPAYPLLGGCGRVRLTADVHPVHRHLVRIAVPHGARSVGRVQEAQGEGVGLADGPPQRRLEEGGVDGSVDLDVLTGVVGGGAGREPMGEPEPLLCPGKRPTIVLVARHDTNPRLRAGTSHGGSGRARRSGGRNPVRSSRAVPRFTLPSPGRADQARTALGGPFQGNT